MKKMIENLNGDALLCCLWIGVGVMVLVMNCVTPLCFLCAWISLVLELFLRAVEGR